MALPSSSSPRSGTVKNESIESLVSKLPNALEVDAQALSDSFQECSIGISSLSEPLPDLPKLPDALEVDEEIVTIGLRECSIELSASAPSIADLPCGNPQPFQDASTGLMEVECSALDNMSSFSVDLPELSVVSQQNYRTTEEREKTRTFPVALSGEESSVSAPSIPPGFGPFGNYSHAHDNGSRVSNGVVSQKESERSERDADDYRTKSGPDTMHLSFANDQLNSREKSEPLQEILESKITQLEFASTELSKIDDEDTKSSRARKRQVKDVRALLDEKDRCPEEKLRLLNNKFLQQVAETRQMEKECLAVNRKWKRAIKEKETLQGDLTKSQALQLKLEALCRELQRQNKAFLDDSKKIVAEEEKKRQELSAKFHDTVKDINMKLEEQGEARVRQLEENEMLRGKLKHFTEQYEIREQHFQHQLRTKSLEQQLLEVKLKQQEDISSQAETKIRIYAEQNSQLLKTEQDLRTQLALYGDKFEQFQETLTKSNEVFATFKSELEKMSKTVKKLEKENASLKKKCEKYDVSSIEFLEERDALKKQLNTAKNQKEKLEALCRSLQAERKQQSTGLDTSTSFPSQLENLKLSSPE